MNPICQRCYCELDVKAPKVLSYNHCPECLYELEKEHFAAIAARDALLRWFVDSCDECDDRESYECALCQVARELLE